MSLERSSEAATVLRNERCPTAGCDGKGDNLVRFEDLHAHCMACGYHENVPGQEAQERQDAGSDRSAASGRFVSIGDGIGPEAIEKRRLSLATCQKFNYWLDHHRQGQVANFYDEKGRIIAQKTRLAGKKFSWRGDSKGCGLFGQHLWPSTGRQIVVTEGEIDCLSMSQAMGNKWPVVSVKNGCGTAYKDIAAQLAWLSGYKRIVLMFDNDEAGQEAAASCADLFEPGQVAIAQLPLKDANEMLVAGRAEELVSAMWNAKAYAPEGVFEAIDLLDEVLTRPEPGMTYPWKCLDVLTHGQRTSELVVWTAGTGIGKSAFLREVAYHLHATHNQRIGYIALEESRKHTALSQLSIALNRPLHIPEVRAVTSDDEIKAAADHALRGVFIYDHFGSVELEKIAPAIRYLVKAQGCKWIILDHLSIMVSGRAQEGDERKRIDETMTKLRTTVQELKIGLHLVSHLRKADGTPYEEGGQISLNALRGSGSIAQLSDMVIGLERNQQDEQHANVTTVRVVKNRFSGETGVTGWLRYTPGTGRLTECEEPKDESEPQDETRGMGEI